jgi:hypothetical protein
VPLFVKVVQLLLVSGVLIDLVIHRAIGCIYPHRYILLPSILCPTPSTQLSILS